MTTECITINPFVLVARPGRTQEPLDILGGEGACATDKASTAKSLSAYS